jgi:ABC-2 type transport system permease protein
VSGVAGAAGVLRYEARMVLRRKGLWLAYGLSCLIYTWAPSIVRVIDRSVAIRPDQLSQLAGQLVFQFNMFMGLVAGIVASECLERDFRTGVSELQRSAPLGRWPYLLGKYLGTLAAVLLPYLLWVVLSGVALVGLGVVPPAFLPKLLAAFAAIATPAYAFVVALSMTGALLAPLRVYQILFTGYWFWGNYLEPRVLPTLNGTLVTPSGVFAFQAFFGGFLWGGHHDRRTPAEAWLNLAVLALCIVGALVAAERYLAWKARRA